MGIAVQFLQIQMEKCAFASGAYIMTQKMHIKQRFNVIQDSTKQKKVVMDQLKLKYYIEV